MPCSPKPALLTSGLDNSSWGCTFCPPRIRVEGSLSASVGKDTGPEDRCLTSASAGGLGRLFNLQESQSPYQ